MLSKRNKDLAALPYVRDVHHNINPEAISCRLLSLIEPEKVFCLGLSHLRLFVYIH